MTELTSKQRSHLSALASKQEAIFQIGKDGVGDSVIQGISAALEARELVKITVLKSADGTAHEVAQSLAASLFATVVKTIGNKIILYRKSTKKNVEHLI